MNTYKIGNIYQIYCIYDPSINYIGSTYNDIGSTYNDIFECFKYYKQGYNNIFNGIFNDIFSYFNKLDISSFNIIKLKEYFIIDDKHLKMYEQLYINKYKSINTINPFDIPIIINLIINTQYNYIKFNKYSEKRNKYNRNYRLKHKKKINEYKRIYYELNKDKNTIMCYICNKKYKNTYFKKHCMTKLHIDNLFKN